VLVKIAGVWDGIWQRKVWELGVVEMLVTIYQITRRHITEDNILEKV
jgi:hypothetical protein